MAPQSSLPCTLHFHPQMNIGFSNFSEMSTAIELKYIVSINMLGYSTAWKAASLCSLSALYIDAVLCCNCFTSQVATEVRAIAILLTTVFMLPELSF